MVFVITTVGLRLLAYYAMAELLSSRQVQATHSLRLTQLRVYVVFKDPDAVLYEKLTYQDVLERELKVMDLAAFTLARDHNLPIRVFNMNKPGALRRVVMGESEGTLISHA